MHIITHLDSSRARRLASRRALLDETLSFCPLDQDAIRRLRSSRLKMALCPTAEPQACLERMMALGGIPASLRELLLRDSRDEFRVTVDDSIRLILDALLDSGHAPGSFLVLFDVEFLLPILRMTWLDEPRRSARNEFFSKILRIPHLPRPAVVISLPNCLPLSLIDWSRSRRLLNC